MRLRISGRGRSFTSSIRPLFSLCWTYINEFPQDDQYVHTEYPDVSSRPRVIVVGEGPGGSPGNLDKAVRKHELVAVETGKSIDDVANALDRKSTRLNSSHVRTSRMPSSA